MCWRSFLILQIRKENVIRPSFKEGFLNVIWKSQKKLLHSVYSDFPVC